MFSNLRVFVIRKVVSSIQGSKKPRKPHYIKYLDTGSVLDHVTRIDHQFPKGKVLKNPSKPFQPLKIIGSYCLTGFNFNGKHIVGECIIEICVPNYGITRKG